MYSHHNKFVVFQVENYLMLSEFENNLIAEMPVILDRKGRRWSLARWGQEILQSCDPVAQHSLLVGVYHCRHQSVANCAVNYVAQKKVNLFLTQFFETLQLLMFSCGVQFLCLNVHFISYLEVCPWRWQLHRVPKHSNCFSVWSNWICVVEGLQV